MWCGKARKKSSAGLVFWEREKKKVGKITQASKAGAAKLLVSFTVGSCEKKACRVIPASYTTHITSIAL